MSVVEQYARAHVVTDEDDPGAIDPGAIPVVLRYDPDSDPRSVRIGLPGTHEWTFSRALLERGLRAPAESGAVRVWPCGRVQPSWSSTRTTVSRSCSSSRRPGQVPARTYTVEPVRT